MRFALRSALTSALGQREAAPTSSRCALLRTVIFVLATGCSSPPPASGSIGVVLGRHNTTGALQVREVPAGLTGDHAGLRAGDRIKMIDGLLADRMAPERIREVLRGPVGSKVMLTVLRGDRVLHLEVTRAPLEKKATPAPAGSARPGG